MKRYRKLFILLVLFVLVPMNVNALMCQNSDKVKYQDMARNIAYSYDSIDKNGRVLFTLTFTNVPTALALRNARSGNWYFSKGQDIVITNLEEAGRYRYEVYAIDGQGCDNISLFTFNILLPYYNKYHTDILCDGIEGYELCQKWLNNQYSYEDWQKKVFAYRKSLIVEPPKTEGKTHIYTTIEKIVDFYGKIYYIVLPVIIIGGMLTIYIYNKKRELF